MTDGHPASAESVRRQFRRLLPLREFKPTARGWTLDVLNLLRRHGMYEFANADVYAHAEELQPLHPENRHLRDKIRQQLQRLRDGGLLRHTGAGRWRLV